MSLSIPAKEYKKYFNTKKEAIEFVRSVNLKTDRRIKNKKERYESFIVDIVDKRDKLVQDKIFEKKILPKIQEFNQTGDKLNINFNKSYTVKVENLVVKNAYPVLTNKIHYKILSNLENKPDERLILGYNISRCETDDNGNDICVKDKFYKTVNDNIIHHYKKNSNDLYDGTLGTVREENYYLNFSGSNGTTANNVSISSSPMPSYGNREGAFFKYKLNKKYFENIQVEMAKYQIFIENDDYYSKINTIDNCLIHSLKISGIDENIINNFSIKCKNNTIPMVEIKKLCEENNLCISVKTKNKTITYGDKNQKIIKLGLLEDHYFVNDKTCLCSYALKNFDKIYNEKEWWCISGIENKRGKTYYKRKTNDKIDSYNLITLLLDNYKKYKNVDEKFLLIDTLTLSEKMMTLTNLNKIDIHNIDLINDSSTYQRVENRKDIKGEILFHNLTKRKNNLDNIASKLCGNDYKNILLNYIVGFDFETNTSYIDGHKSYLVSYNMYKNSDKILEEKTIKGYDCSVTFLMEISKKIYLDINKTLKDLNVYKFLEKNTYDNFFKYYKKNFVNITIIAHNITYDIQFLLKHVNQIKLINRAGNKICGGSFSFYGLKYNIKDSYALTDTSLRNYNEYFKLPIEKEVIPYSLYNIEKYSKNEKFCKIDKAVEMLIKELQFKNIDNNEIKSLCNQFTENINKWNLVKNERFDQVEYAKIYCELDTKIMMDGYYIFKEWCKNDFDIELDDYLTISSLSNAYFTKKGCYDDCLKINGVARYFIQQSVVGGRCMSSNNKKFLLNIHLNDLDGVSLYPSSMERLSKIGGYLKGSPKVLEKHQLNKDFLDSIDGYFIQINLKKVNKHLDFPTISYIDRKGVRIFSNNMIETYTNKKGEIIEIDHRKNIIIDKIAFEDLLEFHEVTNNDYKIIKGYYFNEGRNNKIGETIRYIFDKRNELKANKNPAQVLYKLMMNSAYGKTIMKSQDTQTIYIQGKEEVKKYILKNYQHINQAVFKLVNTEKDIYIVKKKKPIDDHYNMCHIGSEILSMSKRIMNEVMCLAQNNECKIFYQDTDSMHIDNNSIPLLNEKFMEKYKRTLVGKNLGQFHCDFAEAYVKKSDGTGIMVKAEHSVNTIIIGKKSYFDKVLYKYTDSDNKVKEIYKTHFRLKGIPQSVVLKKCKNNPDLIEKLYEKFYNNHSISFDLLSCGVKFKTEQNHCVRSLSKFTRKLSFVDDNTEPIVETAEDIFAVVEDF